jgi:hypothetical protein
MKIILGYRLPLDPKGKPLETYARSFHYYLKQAGHTVLPVGEGHPFNDINTIGDVWKSFDLWIDIDNGRNTKGDLRFQYAYQDRTDKVRMPSAVRFIDSHGNPTLHHRAARAYDHIFFTVWDKRDLFANHSSAHWAPCASDERWFGKTEVITHSYCVGFFGTRGGLERADDLIAVCKGRSSSFDVREIGRKSGIKWPETSIAMNQCQVLFNRGQKHDGPNQRVIESMLTGRPLISDRDERCGMSKLFVENEHYLAYSSPAELGIVFDWALSECGPENTLALDMAERARLLVKEKHLIQHRVAQVLEVCQK